MASTTEIQETTPQGNDLSTFPKSALNLAQHIGQWLTTEEARVFFKKSRKNAVIAFGDFLGLDDKNRATKPTIVQARAAIVSAAMHHPVSIHLFMIWGLLGVMWTAAEEHPKRSEEREQALQRIFDPAEYRDIDKEIAEDESGEMVTLRVYTRTIRALRTPRVLKRGPDMFKRMRMSETSHWCLQVGDHYYELRDPESLTDKDTREVRALKETEELFNSNPDGIRSKGIWFLITKGKTFGKEWEEIYESTTSQSHRRIRARAKRMYEQHFADQDDRSQYNRWVNNCQTFATFLAIAVCEPEERREIVNKTLTSKSTFWLSAVGSVFASIYFYWMKKVIEELRPHVEKRANDPNSHAFWLWADKKLDYVNHRWDYYYLHPQVMLQRQQFLNKTVGNERADQIKRATSGGVAKMKEIHAKKHEWTRSAEIQYRRLRSTDSAEKLKRSEAFAGSGVPKDEGQEQGSYQTTEKVLEKPIQEEPAIIEPGDDKNSEQQDAKTSSEIPNPHEGVESTAYATVKPKHFAHILAKKQQIHDKRKEMKGQMKNKFRRWKSAEEVLSENNRGGDQSEEEDAPRGRKPSVQEVTEAVDSMKGLALVDSLASNDESAKGDIEAKLRDGGQDSIDHDAMTMAAAEMMAELVLQGSNGSSESLLQVPSEDGSKASTV